MSVKPRLYLFYGGDSKASGLAICRWREIFEKKFGLYTRYILEADELSEPQFKQDLSTCLQGQELFSGAKLVVVKRLTSQERGSSYPFTKILLQIISENLTLLDESVTLAVWEEKGLPGSHPLLEKFLAWENAGMAKCQYFPTPLVSNLKKLAENYLQVLGCRLDPPALAWIVEHFNLMEKSLRLQRRLKASDPILEDERSWWLYQVLESGYLHSDKALLRKEDLLAGVDPGPKPVGVFEISQAVARKDWAAARRLLRMHEDNSGDEGSFSNLLAALRWQVKRSPGRLNPKEQEVARQLLLEVELIAKNYNLSWSWLWDIFLDRLENASAGYILDPRKLWLAHVSR